MAEFVPVWGVCCRANCHKMGTKVLVLKQFGPSFAYLLKYTVAHLIRYFLSRPHVAPSTVRLMKTADLISAVISWLFGLVGVLGLVLGLSFLPALFGYADPDQVFMMLGSVALSKGILVFYSFAFGTGILVVSTALFVWVSLLFSMSLYTLIETVVCYFDDQREDGMMEAWAGVLAVNFLLVSLFVYILFGMLIAPSTLLVGGLMLLAMVALLAANYQETYRV